MGIRFIRPHRDRLITLFQIPPRPFLGSCLPGDRKPILSRSIPRIEAAISCPNSEGGMGRELTGNGIYLVYNRIIDGTFRFQRDS